MIAKLEIDEHWIRIQTESLEFSFGRKSFYSDRCYSCDKFRLSPKNFAPWIIPNGGWVCDSCVIEMKLLSKDDVALVRTLNELDRK